MTPEGVRRKRRPSEGFSLFSEKTPVREKDDLFRKTTYNHFMSDENKQSPLSKEDAALWEKVQKTIHTAAPSSQGEQDKVHLKQSQAKSSPEQPTRQEFAALLDGGTIKSNSVATKTPSSATETKAPSIKKHTSSQTQPQPKIQNFSQQEARNISSGKQTIEGMIDLHGFTQAQAEGALRAFLKRAHGDGKRFILVITGKGQKRHQEERSFELGAPEPGVLKRKVPIWLDDMSDIVVSYKSAHKKHGGEGALYVRLRRSKVNKP